jgi:anti-sigma regulatory factor (Ser/Thr protein kinase)
MAVTTTSFPVTDTSHVSAARRGTAQLAAGLAFTEERAGQAALVVTELASNIIKHAGGGEILLTECRDGSRRGIEILSIDSGRGFTDLDGALVDGHSTAGTLGHGLGAVRRQSDHFEMFTAPSKGSAALARLWATRGECVNGANAFAIGVVCVSKPGESECGDAWAVERTRHRASIIVADGLGHGLLAAEAAAAAIAVFSRSPWDPPSTMLENVHLALRPTRGAAVSIAAIDFEHDVALVAGLGNIGGVIISDGSRRSLISHSGTAGHVARRMHEFTYPLTAGATIVMHSDGLGTHWGPDEYPGLWSHDPALIAGVLYRDHTRRRDDVTVLVGRRSPSPAS